MCLFPSYVYNKYIRKHILTDCGHCSACLQQKASRRANRIRYNASPETIALFFTLTYDNNSVPYIDLRDSRISLSDITALSSYDIRSLGRGVLESVDTIDDPLLIYPEDLKSSSPTRYRTLNNFPYSSCVGVCWYPDIQNFFKRLRINLLRHYNYEKKFTYFACSEYGGQTLRPHFHGLIFIEPSAEDLFRCAIVESWPYADSDRTREFIEVARDCASYVASYVNGNAFISRTFSGSRLFHQKHSYSHGFGASIDSFRLTKILENADRGAMCFNREVLIDGIRSYATLPVPSYVINRYFPKFKGFSRLPIDSLRVVLWCPSHLIRFRELLDYSDADLHRIMVSLNNAFARYHAVTGKNRMDFAIDFERVWRCHYHTSNRLLHQGVIDYSEFYEVFEFDLSSRTSDYFPHALFHRKPLSQLRHRVIDSTRLSKVYRFRTKQKFISHTILSSQGYDV